MDKINLHGGNIWRFDKSKIIDFSANINPLGLSRKVKDCIVKNIDSLVHYPEPYCQSLKTNLAHFLKINPENLLFGNGSIELIYLIPHVLGIKKVAIPIPSFAEYEYASKNTGAKCVFINAKDDLKINIERLAKYLNKVDSLFLGNPNNPTGQLFCKEGLKFLLKEAARFKVHIIIDEVFIDFIENPDLLSLVEDTAKSKYLIILRSLTKFFAISGLRLGYIIAHKSLIKKISEFQYPWAVNTLAQLVAKTLIKDTNYINKSRQFIIKEKDFLFNELTKINYLYPYYPSVNFILCRLKDKKHSSKGLTNLLSKKGVLIRDCSNFRGLNDKYFRVAVRTREENLKLISALNKVL